MATRYIRDLLDLPAQVNKGDFVLNLAAGVSDSNAAATLRNYVVTPQLEACFDQALGFIKSAVDGNSSKACYLHGSFGSGKSHFMAVLHLLLQNNPEARAIKELAAVVAKHNAWTQGRKFLLVPFHMIGSRSMEQGILGQYANYVRARHPEAPIPGVYLAESLFEDAKSLRQDIGDEAFFQKLNQHKAAGASGWGAIGAGWTADTFDLAISAAPGDKERTRLVGDLISAFFRSYHNVAAGQDEAYLDLDKGLAVISQHAQALGYDALILFLDELILWLASHAADLSFIHRETQKLVKLVEGQHADRPIPLVSFVARQRDLRKLIGDTVPGAQKLNFDDSVDWSDGRFGVVKLEDRNLPMIASKRVLRVRSAAARQELDAAFEATAGIRKEVMDTLLANEYDRGMFHLIYPFSPALMETLIAASSMLQRERTALKVMMQLLVEQQETLKIGDIVPVGDLYDAVAHGDEAFSQDMKVHFDNARKLYHEKLLPMLEATHGRRDELMAKPLDDPARINFCNDDRLVKTLLLAALVPGVNSLRALTANRLAALNHGTIRSPIPGKEPSTVLQKCKAWAAEVGEIKIGDEATNPTISIQLSGVDTEAIVAAAEHEDNPGNQMRMVRQVLFEELGIENVDQMYLTYEFMWRNTHRTCDVIYGNVRSLPETSLTANPPDWKVINRNLLKQIAEPLQLGEQGETHFVLGQRWKDHFTRKASEAGRTMTVADLRKWIDQQSRPMGLPKECGNLIILVFAAQTNRSFFRHGAPFDAALANLPDEAELREQQLPAETAWVTAVERASRIFGVVTSPLLNAANLSKLVDGIQTPVKESFEVCRQLTLKLAGHLADFGAVKEQAPRWQTATAVLALLEAIRDAHPAQVIETLADVVPQTSEAAMGSSFKSASQVVNVLAATQWKLFDSIRHLQDEGAATAQALLGRVCEALRSDQHVTDIGPVLAVEQTKAIDLLTPSRGGGATAVATGSGPVGGAVTEKRPPAESGRKVVDSGSRTDLSPAEAEREIARLRKQLRNKQSARVDVSWVIEE